jgi:hypothetical protein
MHHLKISRTKKISAILRLCARLLATFVLIEGINRNFRAETQRKRNFDHEVELIDNLIKMHAK